MFCGRDPQKIAWWGKCCPTARVRALCKLDRRQMETMETKLREILDNYGVDKLAAVAADSYLKARVVFFCRAADALSRLASAEDPEQRSADVEEKLAVAEQKLRQVVLASGFTALPRVRRDNVSPLDLGFRVRVYGLEPQAPK